MQSVKAAPRVEPIRLTLSGNQDVRNANELQRSLTELLSKNNAVSIDCNAIESMDAACLQLLLAAKRESQNGVQFIAEPNSEAARWIQYSGLANTLLGRPTTSTFA
jgi:anti-anti-sigma factor